MILVIFSKTKNELIKSTYIVDKKTKHLLTRIKANQVAIINHPDIDEIAAYSLIEKKVKAVINFSTSITGRYPTQGLKKLLKARIPVYDVGDYYDVFAQLIDNNEVIIDNMAKVAIFEGIKDVQIPLKHWTLKSWEMAFNRGNNNIEQELNRFIDNTLEYALREKDFVLKPFNPPKLKTKLKGKHVVVVVRGNNYREDLAAIRTYISDYHPVLIGVDGGADLLLDNGYKPAIIIGDMDSVSDKALKSGAEIIVHAYPNGFAPGLERIQGLGLEVKVIPSIGTSEDVAMLMAYEGQAELIVALGAHSNMVDFLEKGRKGMSSTVLVRMKIGTKLVDAKGVSKLYQPRGDWKALSLMGIAAITPIISISLINHDMVRILEIVWINLKMLVT